MILPAFAGGLDLCFGLLLLAAPSSATPPPNVLLVTIDTLRADRLHAYGHDIETPFTDRLAREGVLLEDAVVQAPQTRPSHASILTGLQPYEHGIRDNFSGALRKDVPTLATLLTAHGYDTAAFIGGSPLTASSGLDRGFALFDDHLGPGAATPASLGERRGDAVVASALAWLRRPRAKPFLAWVHLYDPHAPYAAPAPYGARYRGRAYDGEVAFADAQIGRLLAFLDQKGLAASTLVVVTSDHGEGLGEHGEDEHLMFLYDSTLRVPMLVRWPSGLPAGRRVGGQFRSVDLLPTLLELLRAPAPARSGGTSRAAELRSGRAIPENASYAESLYGALHFGYAPIRAVRAEGWKYIDAPRAELYRIRDDPRETQNLLDLRAPAAARLREQLAGFDRGLELPKLEVPEDAGAIERLVALGYVGAGGPGPAATGIDPKDRIAEHQAYTRDVQEALRLFKAADYDRALPILERLSRQKTASFEVQYFYGRALLRKRRYAEASRALEEARRLLPRVTAVYVELAQAFRLLGRVKEARAVVDRGLALDDKSSALWEEGGLAALAMGDLTVARAAFETTLVHDPRALRARLALSALLREAGDRSAALAQMREATRLDPRSSPAWNALGVLFAAGGQSREARDAFTTALRLAPADADVLFHLAMLDLAAGDAAAAVPLLERALAAAPDFPEARAALDRARGASAQSERRTP